MLNRLKFVGAFLIGTSVFISSSEAAPALLKKETIDQVLASVMKHWNPSHAYQRTHGIHIEVRFELDRDGNILGQPKVLVRGGDEAQRRDFAMEAQRAVSLSAPFKMLPVDKYESWHTIIVRFVN
jgi:hypothetical protein